MDPPPRPNSSATNHPSVALFDVFLRLRPSATASLTHPPNRFLNVEAPVHDNPTHITIHPPSGEQHRKRAIEKFAFTRVFEENAGQTDVFNGTAMASIIEGVLSKGRAERDGLVATLGVTGSGKSHTILGSKTQRGITQMSLDVLYRNIGSQIASSSSAPTVYSLAATDVSESQLFSATTFLDSVYGDPSDSRMNSRAQTPMLVSDESLMSMNEEESTIITPMYPSLRTLRPSVFLNNPSARPSMMSSSTPRVPKHVPLRSMGSSIGGRIARLTRSVAAKSNMSPIKEASSFIGMPTPSKSRREPRPSMLPQTPRMSDVNIEVDPDYEYAIVVSMYEVYNDRIYDLLTMSTATAKAGVGKRRALLFKSTELSPDRKVVAGLRKIICGTLDEALTVLETGLIERRVAGTGSNATSSRSHGFFCVELKKRNKARASPWTSSSLTIVDLAGSERARNAKTAGATLAEAGKINESLMYLGQCMQMQSDNQDTTNPRSLVPYRQCKLTELLFSNSFPTSTTHAYAQPRNPQKGIMIVTADPVGDFNATSQILRYSALAREVTVPRIPSVTSTILSGTTANTRPPTASGRTTPASNQEDLDHALQEIGRLNEEMEVMELRLNDELTRRLAAESSLRFSEERIQEIEQSVRDECMDEMEVRIEAERRRWKSLWDEQQDRNDEHLDRKIELLSGSDGAIKIFEDPVPSEAERVEELENENEVLRKRIERLEREVQGQSPTKKMRVLKTRKWEVDVGEGSPM